MRVAIPIWDGRVSPVFDEARSIRVANIREGTVTGISDHSLEIDRRAESLVRLGVDLLICAAISTPLESMLWKSGVEVIPDTCGTAEEIVEAFAEGKEELARFRSPGKTRRPRSGREDRSHPKLDLKPVVEENR